MKDLVSSPIDGHEPVGSTATGAIVADPCTPGPGATDISGPERDPSQTPTLPSPSFHVAPPTSQLREMSGLF